MLLCGISHKTTKLYHLPLFYIQLHVSAPSSFSTTFPVLCVLKSFVPVLAKFAWGHQMFWVSWSNKNMTFFHNAYEHFRFPNGEEHICGSRTAISQPLVGSSRSGWGKICRLMVIERGLRLKNEKWLCEEKSVSVWVGTLFCLVLYFHFCYLFVISLYMLFCSNINKLRRLFYCAAG